MFPGVEQRRKGFNNCIKLVFDQMEFSQAMSDAYSGLYYLSLASEKLGLIPKMPYEENYEAMYEIRFKFFRNIPAPNYINFDSYETIKETDLEFEVPELLKRAKDWMMSAKSRLAQMSSVPEDIRNTEVYSNEYLESVMKLIVRNSMNVAKISMMTMGGKTPPPKTRIFVDLTNSMNILPALEVK